MPKLINANLPLIVAALLCPLLAYLTSVCTCKYLDCLHKNQEIKRILRESDAILERWKHE